MVPWENVLARQQRTSLVDGELYDEFVVDTMRRDKPGWSIPIRPVDLPSRRMHWPQCRHRRLNSGTAHRCPECGAKVDGTVGRPLETIRDAFLGRVPGR